MFNLNESNITKYKILSNYEVKEQNIEVVELLHLKTNAKIILFICDDENRVFNIAFKTPVDNGKGTPHILEHSVLCGSKKYNVKDPFIELAKGSMKTFLNAMTFPDKTCYPIASANVKDFHNLMGVYLDAVFYPNAIKDDRIFKQEGWHYEVDNVKDDLKVNGVVFNEMKGVYSDPDSIMESAILRNLFADTNYAYESGGAIIEVKKVKLGSFDTIKTIIKFPMKPAGIAYIGSYTIPFKSFSYVVKVQCIEQGDTGMRDTIILEMMIRNGTVQLGEEQGIMKGWMRDPYDDSIHLPYMMNLSESEEFDKMFPKHSYPSV